MNRNLLIVLIPLAILVVIGLAWLYIVLERGSLIVDTIPSDAAISLNGHSYKVNQKISLKPGSYQVKESRGGFLSTTIGVNVRANKTTAIQNYLVIDSNSAVGRQYLADHPKESLEYEGRAGVKVDQHAQQVTNSNPIIKLLPYVASSFRVDYGVSQAHPNTDAVAIYITASTTQAKQAALDWIKSQGYDPAKLEIIYQ